MKYSNSTNPLGLGHVIKVHAWLNQHPEFAPDPIASSSETDDAEWVMGTIIAADPAVTNDSWQHVIGVTKIAAVVIGSFLGATVSSVALTYTGNYPVNMLLLLLLLVFVPGLMLIGSLVIRLFVKKEASGATAMMAKLLQRVNDSAAEYMAQNLWRYGDVLYWQSQAVLQRFSIAFLTMALIVFLGLVMFSDLAFGWSSTLQLDPSTVFAVANFLSLPWQAWLPVAAPTYELVEASRFFRMNPDNDPALLGQWWPFIAMCIFVWALIPRMVMAGVAAIKSRESLREALLKHPEVTALLRHRGAAAVAYSGQSSVHAEEEEIALVQTSNHADVDVCILWNDAVGEGLAFRMGDSTVELFEQLPTEFKRVCVVVKGWEPPLLEFLDFIRSLRARVGDEIEIVVRTTSLPEHPLEENDRHIWRATLARLHDAKVYLEAEA